MVLDVVLLCAGHTTRCMARGTPCLACLLAQQPVLPHAANVAIGIGVRCGTFTLLPPLEPRFISIMHSIIKKGFG